MNDLFVLLLLTGGAAAYFIVLSVRMPRNCAPTKQALEALHRMVTLPSLSFAHPSALFDPGDYNLLISDPRLSEAAISYRHNIRRIALLWLKLLQNDVIVLWRFRRLLTVCGVYEGLRVEAATAGKAASLAFLVIALRVSVKVAGPFAFSKAALKVREAVHSFSHACAETLGSVSPNNLNSLEKRWRRLATRSVA